MMSGCLDRAQCPQLDMPDLSEKRNHIASIVAGSLVRFKIVMYFNFVCSYFLVYYSIGYLDYS